MNATLTLPSTTAKPRRSRVSAVDEQREITDDFSKDRLRWSNLDYLVIGWIAVMHLGCLAAPIAFTWSAVLVALLLHWLTASIGICLGYHRYLSHKSLKLATPAKFFTMLCGALSAEGSPLRWTANHRLHHARSDKEGDPHSPLEGKWWSHLLWMFLTHAPKADAALMRRYIPDLANDRMLRFFDKTFVWWSLALAAGLYALGGWPWLVWGMFVRMTLCYHSTWLVNSATHLWGYRNYETKDESRNLWWVAILAYGEGWHNNHHAHPSVAPAGHKWYEFDITYQAIRLFRACGLAWDVNDRIPVSAQPAKVVADEPATAAAAERELASVA